LLPKPDLFVAGGQGGLLLTDVTGSFSHPHNWVKARNPAAHKNDYVSSAVIARVLSDIDAHGKIRHAYLGVLPGQTDPKRGGVGLAAVLEGSPAAKAALKAGDVILSVDGTPCGNSAHFTGALVPRRPGEKVTLTVHGRGAIVVTLGDRLEARRKFLTPKQIGLDCVELDNSLRRFLRIPEGMRGVVVVEVRDGPAKRGGVERGEVIVEVNGKPARDVAELEALIAGAAGTINVTVLRDGQKTLRHLPLGQSGADSGAR
jgi:serine protease Do